MLTLVIGGSASGKSEYAESLVQAISGYPRIYIATMMPHDKECEARIARHQKLRADKGFETLECYLNIASVTIPENAIVLLECMSNLVANELFDPRGSGTQAEEVILAGVSNLCQQAREVIIVTNEVFADGMNFTGEMKNYLKCLGGINRQLAAMAVGVIEVVAGIPIVHK